MNQEISKLAGILRSSPSTVFFGGAGVSTESGIPDFRSESGLYSATNAGGGRPGMEPRPYSPEELLSRGVFEREPRLFFRYYKENLITRDARPNPGHLTLAGLERAGKLDCVITQNIDGLHQAAGSKNVLELHGSNWRQYCVTCGARYTLDYILAPENCDGEVPKCEKCGGIVRPDVVLYDERLDESVMERAEEAVSRAAALIVGGTSLTVYPAAGLLEYFRGSALVLINKSATLYDRYADLVIREPIGEALAKAAEGIG